MGRRTQDWILHIDAQLERLSGEITPGKPKVARQKGWAPRVDVLEGGLEVVLRIELAGVKLSNLALNYNTARHTITVRGVRVDDLADSNARLSPHQLEIEFGEFGREIVLPDVELDIQGTQTQFRDGILMIVIPKRSEGGDHIIIERTVTIHKLT